MMVSFFWTLQVTLTFYMSTALESIVNPSSPTVSCGINDDCTVICNATSACAYKTFYFYNHSIDIQCSSSEACKRSQIFTSNVQSFTASMTGPESFLNGNLYTSSTDIDIHVQCGPSSGSQECFAARFYYLNQGQSTHSCEGAEGCRRSMIHAISPVALVCKGSLSCFRASFVLPSDEQLNQQSSLTVYSGYADTTDIMKVYSLYPFTNVISADGTALDAIHFVYGMRFNQYCIVSDTSCMDEVATNIANYDELTIINTYPEGITSQSLTYNGDVLIFATFKSTTFTPPSIPDTNTLSILCLYCYSVTFQLEGLQNAVLSDTSGLLWYSSIAGPSGYFELSIMHWSKFNKYLLQNTSTITARSLGENAEVHLGNALDVHIKCSLQSDGSLYWKCPNANIWSTLQRNELHLATATAGYWDLDTSYEFLIHFDFEEYPCTYIHYTSNCSFMTFNPTGAPTHATNNPSQSPTNNPSENPSQKTGNPSSIPTHSPSHYPSSQPTEPPTRVPTQAPSSLPSKQPTQLPSTAPTVTPTRGGEHEVNDATDTTDTVEPESVVADQSSIAWIVVAIVIGLSVVIICTATVLIVCYRKGKSTTDKTIQKLEPKECPLAQQRDMNMNHEAAMNAGQLMSAISESKPALQLGTSESRQETGTAEYTEGNGDDDNVNIAPDEFIIDGDDEMHDTIR